MKFLCILVFAVCWAMPMRGHGDVSARLVVPESVYATEVWTNTVEITVDALPAPRGNTSPVYSPRNDFRMPSAMIFGEREMLVHADCDWYSEQTLGGFAGVDNNSDLLAGRSRLVWTLNNVSNEPFSLAQFPMGERREGDKWIYTIAFPPFKAHEPGEISFRGARLAIPVIVPQDAGRARVELRTVQTKAGVVKILDAPVEGRPASYCGLIATDLESRLDASSVSVSAGDILEFELSLKTSGEARRIRMPRMPETKMFKPSGTPKEIQSGDGERKWQWRMRAMDSGTFEFPPIRISYFNPRERRYIDVSTKAIPIQVTPNAAVVLDYAGDDEAWPMPDGLLEGDGFRRDIPVTGFWRWAAGAWILAFAIMCAIGRVRRRAMAAFFVALALAAAAWCFVLVEYGASSGDGASRFTWGRAMSLAGNAATVDEFKAAAKAFEAVVEGGADNPDVWKNLGGTLYFAGDFIRSRDAYLAAERFSGADAATRRGLVAVNARLKNDPSAELPLDRQLLRPWCALGVEGRLVFAISVVCAFLCVWCVLPLMTRRGAVAALAGLCLFSCAAADDISLSAEFVPQKVYVNEPLSVVLTCTMPRDVELDNWRLSNLPEGGVWQGMEELGGAIETPSNIVKRVRINGRMTEPVKVKCALHIFGMAMRSARQGSASFMFGNSFSTSAPPAQLEVLELPEEGRPEGFSGAVGTGRLDMTLSKTQYRPGDILEAEYELDFSGYIPESATMRVVDVPGGLKAYDLKEESRAGGKIVWKQTFLAEGTNVTCSAAAEFDCFDAKEGRYCVVRAEPVPLSFEPAEPATAPSVVAVGDGTEAAAGEVVKVHFGPSERSPVIFTVKRELVPAASGWRRISTPRGEGWVE